MLMCCFKFRDCIDIEFIDINVGSLCIAFKGVERGYIMFEILRL
jgi:hypothetical protein